MELVNSNSAITEEVKKSSSSTFVPDTKFVELVKHAISCQYDFGKCPVPGCAITQKIMAFLSPSVARKRNRIEQQISNRKRSRYQPIMRSSSSHPTKPSCRIHEAPPKGEFVQTRVEYYLTRCSDYNPLLTTLTKDELKKYVEFLKSRYIQTYYGPLLQLLMQHKDNHGIFNVPVDPEAQNLPTYYSIVTEPMDLGTIRDKLARGEYTSSNDLIRDIRLTFNNAKKFNPATHFISNCASSLLKLLDSELDKIRTRIEQNRTNQHNHTCSLCHGYPCRLCGEKCLKYSPPVYVCDGDCHERILRNATYYIIRGKKGRYCQKCYSKKVVGMDKADRKNLFVRKKNDDVFPETWIQCSRCKEWMHCVCGLVHPRQVSSSYVCPLCLIDDPHRVIKVQLGAREIPTCHLSDYLTNCINECVDQEVVKLPSRYRLNQEQLQDLKNSLIIRVVSNIETNVSVKNCLIPLYSSLNEKELKIPYRSKCIAFFQHRDGIDILLFVLYVHEFNEHVPQANQRCIYISYLDSVHFMSPRFLRTPLYHTILNSYLAYAKQHGYCRAHIWACPPSRGDDYIFSHHPRDQRTPNADHLIDWYRALLAKGVEKGIVSHVSCQIDELLHMNATRSNNQDIILRQIRLFSLQGNSDTELPEMILERGQSISPIPTSPVSSDYESENSNSNDVESELSSELSSLSGTTTHSSTHYSTTKTSGIASVINGTMSELERALYSTIPYFEGDYLPYVCEDILKDIYQDSQKAKTTRPVFSFIFLFLFSSYHMFLLFLHLQRIKQNYEID